tara:strand:- start:5798 stop:6076 length:279 start_codon:yes stop_codon:yes gene_type:complete
MESSELKKMLNEILHRLEKIERKIDKMKYGQYDRPMPPYVPPFDEEDDERNPYPYDPFKRDRGTDPKRRKRFPYRDDDYDDENSGGVAPHQR